MLIHLQSGCCKSGIDITDVDHYARRYAKRFESGSYLNDDGNYVCPACSKRFKCMSDILQHAERANCGEDLDASTSSVKMFLDYFKMLTA